MSVLKVKIAELRESRKLDNKTAMATALSGRHSCFMPVSCMLWWQED